MKVHLENDSSNNMRSTYVHSIGVDEPLIMYRAGKSYYYHADGTQDGGGHSYSYDRLNRLTSAQHPFTQQAFNPNEGFSYDFVGNRTSGPNGATIQYDRANRIISDDKYTYAFDANGNMVSKTDRATGVITRYTYDVENQLIRIDFPNGTFAEYRYDGLGRRFEKNVNGVITRYIYDNEDIHLEYDGANQMKAAYIHGIGVDEPLIMYRGGKSYFYHADGLGSIVQLTDAAGNVVKSYMYNSFGNVVKETGTIENPYTYTGRERDVESGLYYHRLRYYDPVQGRFISSDPIKSIERFEYANNNPMLLRDPYGISPGVQGQQVFKEGGLIIWNDVDQFNWHVAQGHKTNELGSIRVVKGEIRKVKGKIPTKVFGKAKGILKKGGIVIAIGIIIADAVEASQVCGMAYAAQTVGTGLVDVAIGLPKLALETGWSIGDQIGQVEIGGESVHEFWGRQFYNLARSIGVTE